MRLLRVARFLLLPAILVHRTAEGTCKELKFCSGHGRCVNEDFCDCYDGWGSASDLSPYKAPDCSRRVCPSGIAWADTPTMDGLAHNLAECSNKGTCNRVTGRCECFRNFVGDACQRSKCPNGCSGHGVCKSMRRLAKEYAVNTTTYENSVGDNGFVALIRVDDTAWDADSIFGCVCDSSWTVGPYAYQVNEPEWFGPDCSKRHCPSGDNPYTKENELNCFNVTSPYTNIPGTLHNLCHVDCSNLGLCDYKTGVCDCFSGQYGAACNYSPGLEPNITRPAPEIETDDYVPPSDDH
mmetsp:Transcript_21239/g.23063  ORF Transcript_21239/g.23063 Transcript_21239/m.23063 type:complete len:295 (+) Transcript_21239:31-915(+)